MKENPKNSLLNVKHSLTFNIMSYYGTSLGMGLAGERTVRTLLEELGIQTEDSSKYENIMQDIDCWITVGNQFEEIGVTPGIYPLSIKRQESGCKYKNIGFELYQQENPTGVNDLRTDDERWLPVGWFNTGVCPIYAILQGTKVRVMTKVAVLHSIKTFGWLRKRPLTAAIRNAISKTARYSDAICGYLNTTDVHQVEYNHHDQSKVIIRPTAPSSPRTCS